MADANVVIAGGGLIGLSVAWRCAQAGLSVTVVDPQDDRGAWHAAGGMLAPITEAAYGEEHLLGLARASLERYPAFVAELESATGTTVGLRTSGTVMVGFDADDMRAIDDLHRFHLELGLPVQRLTAGQARRREPSLTPRLRGAVHVPADHSVDARKLQSALAQAAFAVAGVRLVPTLAESLIVDNGRAAGVRLATGDSLRGDTVVLAMGAWSAKLGGAPPLPVRPIGGQILRLRGEELLTGTVRALVRGRFVYLVPIAEGGLIVGATSEEKGFSTVVTAGGVYELLRDAIEVLPGISELELTETVVRFRPGTPDNAPLLGPCELPGLVLATGHYRNGVLLTPVTADAIADLIVNGALPDAARGFGLDRFSTVHSGGLR